jgi:hypothetical protein
MERRYVVADEDARALVRQLREEVNHSMNLERAIQQMPAEARSVLHQLTKRARTERVSAARLAAGEDEAPRKGRVWRQG